MAEVLPFPLARRRDLVRRQAERYCDQTPKGAENTLFYQLQRQRDALLGKGVDPARVEVEVRSLEIEIRCEALRLCFSPQVGA